MTHYFIHGMPAGPDQQAFVDERQQSWINEIGLANLPCLHVGCGEKRLAWAINIDPSPSRARWIDYPDDVQDLSRWPDGYFGSAISSHVLPSVRDLGRAFCEMARVLKPGGLMAHVIPDHSYAPRRCDPRFEWGYMHHSWHSPAHFQAVMDQFSDLFRVVELAHFPEFNFSFRVLAERI